MVLKSHYHVKDTPIGKQVTASLDAGKTNWTLINGVNVGSDVDERSGRQYMLKQLMMRWHIGPSYTSSSTPNIKPFRYMICIIRDSQPQSDFPNWTEVFQTATIDSFMNIDNAGRFKSVYRYCGNYGTWRDAAGTSTGTGNLQLTEPNHGEFIKNLSDRVRFDGDTDSITHLANGAYYVGFIVESYDGAAFSASAPDNRPKFVAECRIRYQDL